MSLTSWRMVRAPWAETAFDGEGARRFGGRWNSPGTRMVYTSRYRSLAVLEILVHLTGATHIPAFKLLPVQFDRSLVEELPRDTLPPTWTHPGLDPDLQQAGDEWVARARKPVLRVPSAIVPAESNYLFNPAHPAFSRLRRGPSEDFRLDLRLS